MHAAALSSLPATVQIHLAFASAALVLGPLALTARKGSPRHRGFGYTWVLAMLGAAISSLFLLDRRLPNLMGYTPIHLLTLLTFVGLSVGLYRVIVLRHIAGHRSAMLKTYFGGCVGAGLFTLLPGRYLGDLLWHHALGLI